MILEKLGRNMLRITENQIKLIRVIVMILEDVVIMEESQQVRQSSSDNENA